MHAKVKFLAFLCLPSFIALRGWVNNDKCVTLLKILVTTRKEKDEGLNAVVMVAFNRNGLLPLARPAFAFNHFKM